MFLIRVSLAPAPGQSLPTRQRRASAPRTPTIPRPSQPKRRRFCGVRLRPVRRARICLRAPAALNKRSPTIHSIAPRFLTRASRVFGFRASTVYSAFKPVWRNADAESNGARGAFGNRTFATLFRAVGRRRSQTPRPRFWPSSGSIHEDLRAAQAMQALLVEWQMEQGMVNRATDRVEEARSKLIEIQTNLKVAAAHVSEVEERWNKSTKPDEQVVESGSGAGAGPRSRH